VVVFVSLKFYHVFELSIIILMWSLSLLFKDINLSLIYMYKETMFFVALETLYHCPPLGHIL
jgi:hypothetical protein